MPRGTVKWFNDDKGYGFIMSDDGGDDLFVHYRFIVQEGGRGWRTLQEGQSVEFEVQQSAKGPQAHQVRVIDEVDDALGEDWDGGEEGRLPGIDDW